MARKSFLFIIFILSFSWLVSGCQTTPSSALKLTLTLEENSEFPPIHLRVTDLRPQHHLVQIHRGRQPAEFATSSQPLGSLISAALQSSLQINQEAMQTLHIKVDRGICTVQQSMSSHEAVCEVVLIAQSEGPRGELTKTFSRRRTREGALQVSMENLASDLSSLFSAALNSALNDSGMEQWLNSQSEILEQQEN